METLPVEMLGKIVQHMSPQDLSHASAVCRTWRDVFNQDWIWAQYCDPDLKEPLRTIPCVAAPAFVSPEVENSTLTPICQWRLAFMRENHLWGNWRCKGIKNYKRENIIVEENFEQLGSCLSIDFLTDTVIVVYSTNHIQIFDVSVMPAALVAKIENNNWFCLGLKSPCSVIGTNLVMVQKSRTIEVYSIDLTEKSIKLKHNISLGYEDLHDYTGSRVIRNNFLRITGHCSKLVVFDLETGEKKKESACPVIAKNWEITCSATSDFVVIMFYVPLADGTLNTEYYIYNLKQLAFFPNPLDNFIGHAMCTRLHRDFLACRTHHGLTILNCQTREVLLRTFESDINREYYLHDCDIDIINDSFVFSDQEVDPDGNSSCFLRIFSLPGKTLSTLCKCDVKNGYRIKIIQNKFIAVFGFMRDVTDNVWEISGNSVKKADICVLKDAKINRSFTKVINNVFSNSEYSRVRYVRPFW